MGNCISSCMDVRIFSQQSQVERASLTILHVQKRNFYRKFTFPRERKCFSSSIAAKLLEVRTTPKTSQIPLLSFTTTTMADSSIVASSNSDSRYQISSNHGNFIIYLIRVWSWIENLPDLCIVTWAEIGNGLSGENAFLLFRPEQNNDFAGENVFPLFRPKQNPSAIFIFSSTNHFPQFLEVREPTF